MSTVAKIASGRNANLKFVLFELSCQAQGALAQQDEEEAYRTLFKENEPAEETAGETEDSDGGEPGEEEEAEEMYFDALNPEDF